LSGALLLTTSTAVAQVIALAASPFLTRIYSPEDFGVFAVFGAFLAISTVVACLRYELAIVLPTDNRSAIAVLKLSCYSALLVTVMVGLGVATFGADLAALTEITAHRWLLALLPVALLLAGLNRAGSYWMIRKQAFGYLSASKLTQSVPQTIVQLILGYLVLGPLGLVLGDIIGKVTGTATLWYGLAKQMIPRQSRISRQELHQAARRYRRFPQVSSWSAVINEVGSMAPTLLLAGFFGPGTAGGYALVRRVFQVPMDLIGQSITSLFVGDVSRICREGEVGLRSTFLRYLTGLFVLGAGPAAVLFFFGEVIFIWAFGADWGEAGRYAEILSVGFLFRFAISPLGQILSLLEMQSLQLIWDAARASVLISAIVVPYLLGLSAGDALVAYIIALITMQSVYVGLALWGINRVAP
jgi:O-antigen/teichoic acid export membrane protein